jgi:trypsin
VLGGRLVLAAAALSLGLAAASSPAGAVTATPRIVNPDGAGAVPWQAALVPRRADGSVDLPLAVFCGASIRDETHVITAAHCVVETDAREISIAAGFVSRSNAADGQIRPVAAISSNPLYGTGPGHDVAVLTLARPLTFTSAVAALPVVEAAGADVGRTALVSGWGYLAPQDPPGTQPDALRYGLVDVHDPSSCSTFGAAFVSDQMLCAGRTDPTRTVDACQGDSGGPLARYDGTPSGVDGRPTPADFDALIGIVSFGRGCADPRYPGIYARLSQPDNNARATDPNPPPRAEPTAPPSVAGSPAVGQTLTCQTGGWTDPAADLSVRWLSAKLDAQGHVSDVRGDTDGGTLTLTDAFAGRIVSCEVRATNGGGYRRQQARPIGPVSATPVAASVSGQNRTQSLARPKARITRRSCAHRRCRLTIVARGAGATAVRATATVRRLTHCRAAQGCAASRRLTVHRASAGVFTVTSARLAPGRYRFTIVATSAAGLAAAPVSAVLTVGRR